MATKGAQQFTYACTVKHDADVRYVSPHPFVEGGFITASYDKTAKVWNTGKGSGSEVSTFVGHTGWVACAVYAQGAEGKKSYLATAGWDKNLVLWDLETCQPEWILEAHTDKVTCIASLKGGEIVTGGYDKTAIIWKDGYLVKRLTSHIAPVACCCGLENGDAVTGGAHGDNSLIRWSPKGDLIAQFKSHTSGVRGVASVSATEFVSCSNDMTLILWSINGPLLQTFAGHKNQVYSVAALPSGELISGSEDRTVKVWNMEGGCTQTIAMPSFVFTVCSLTNGDIVVGCTDGTARVFSRSPDRIAAAEQIKEFEDLVANQKVNKGGLGGLDMATLPGPEALSVPGTAEGQQKIIKRERGAEVYCWSVAKAMWEKIGDVVDGDGEEYTGPTKTVYKGKEWDYVFDVDLTGDSKGMFKLPYNKGENPYAAAQRFIHDHSERGIHNGHLDEIAKFIFDNAEGTGIAATVDTGAFVSDYAKEAAAAAAAGQSSTMSNMEALRKMEKEGTSTAFSEYAKEAAAAGIQSTSVQDNMKRLGDGDGVAFSTYAREAAGIAAADSSELPAGVLGDLTTYTKINPAGMAKKLSQQNTEQPPIASLDALLKAVDTLGAGTLAVIPAEVETIIRTWAQGQRFAAIDFVRQAVLIPSVVIDLGSKVGGSVVMDVFTMFRGSDVAEATGPEQGLCLKAFCNLFATPAGCAVAESLALKAFDALQKVWKTCEQPVRVLYATLLLNYARYYRKKNDAASAADVVPVLCTGLLYEKEPPVMEVIINALGCLILPSGEHGIAEICLDRASKCFLQDSLRAIIAPTPATADVVDRLRALLMSLQC